MTPFRTRTPARRPAGASLTALATALRAFGAFGALVSAVAARPAAAQGPFAGAWVVRSWEPAPWLGGAARGRVAAAPGLVGARVTVGEHRLVAPEPLGCARPEYAVQDVPYDYLFQGALTEPGAQGAALGFRGARVRTLATGCDVELHLRDAETALFALDNVIYTLRRARPGAAGRAGRRPRRAARGDGA